MFGKYLVLLRQPDVAQMVVIAFLSRMPMGMVGLSMLMFLRETLGSFTLAGSAVGAYFIAMAAGAPIQGRLMDRIGPRLPLLVTGSIQPLALIALLLCARLGLPFSSVLACAIAAGAFQAPITVLTRTLWRHRFDDESDRRLAFAIDAVMIEFNFTLGPALVAAMLTIAHPTAAFVMSIAVVIGAFLLFVRSPSLKYWKHDPHAERHMFGPLTEPRLLLVFGASFGLTFSFGMLEVGYPGYATLIGLPALGGVLLAINSIGSATGGAVYGALHLRASVERQFAFTLALMALPLFLHAWVDQRIIFAIVAFFAGVTIAPTLISQTLLVSRLSPSKYATEAFTWSSTFIISGLGTGVAVGGTLIETHGVKSAFVAGGISVAATSGIALLLSPKKAAQVH
jgi:MFS family permease